MADSVAFTLIVVHLTGQSLTGKMVTVAGDKVEVAKEQEEGKNDRGTITHYCLSRHM